MSASLEEDFQSAVSEAPAPHHVPEILLTTPASCPNCAALTKENRKLSNSIKTMREAAKKRRAEIRKLQKKGMWPLQEDIYIPVWNLSILVYKYRAPDSKTETLRVHQKPKTETLFEPQKSYFGCSVIQLLYIIVHRQDNWPRIIV